MSAALQVVSCGPALSLQDFGRRMPRQLFLLFLRPKAITPARAQAPGAPRALGAGGIGDPARVQSGHAGPGIEAGDARETRIDHDVDAFDRQAGFGDVGCKHHLALVCQPARQRCDGLLLFLL